MNLQLPTERPLNRRRLLQAAAGTAAAASVTGPLAWPTGASASGGRDRHDTKPPHKRVPGGIPLDSAVIHVWAPGDPSVTLPFTGATLQGFDLEPTTILDFRGFSAVAFHVRRSW